jgi:hypothetical protein
MFDPVVKKKQESVMSSPGTSSSAGTLRSTSRSHVESSSSKRKDKVGPSLPSGEVSTSVFTSDKDSAPDTFSLILFLHGLT